MRWWYYYICKCCYGNKTVANTQNQDDFIVKAFNDIKAADLTLDLHAEGLPAGIPGFKLFLNGDAYTDYTLTAGTGASYSINPNSTFLPDKFPVYIKDDVVLNFPERGFTKKYIPTINKLQDLGLAIKPKYFTDAYEVNDNSNPNLDFILKSLK